MTLLDITQTSYFLYWIQERHKIHLKRLAGEPWPWTEDRILQDYFFCNPYRENDKTTIWFRKNIRDFYGINDVLMATVIFRRFNYIPTGELLLRESLLTNWDAEWCVKVLKNRPKVFTGAFMISSPNHVPKLPEICRMITAQWAQKDRLLQQITEGNSLERAWYALRSEHHMGLMPYEVVCDLRWTPLLAEATDIDEWAYFGPGGQRGIKRIMGHKVDGADVSLVDQTLCLRVACELLEITRKSLREMHRVQPFEMREIEHSLCEYDKYMRILREGKSKRRYYHDHRNA